MAAKLTALELKALRSMPEFQRALAYETALDAEARAEGARKEAAFVNPDGSFNHDDPNKNKWTRSGLYGKAAAYAEGDWYSSH